jgi:serine protease inhibitor ecotin
MKKLLGIVFLGVAMVVASAAWAQDMAGQKVKLTPQQRAEKLTQAMSRQLRLSPEQVEKVQAINLKYAEKNAQVKRDTTALKANAEAKNAEMKEVLTPAQYESC